jgi:hypothetical protein
MSLAEIKAEIAKLSPEEVVELKQHLSSDPWDDPEYLAELDRRHAEMQRGINVLTKEEVLARLHTARKAV